PHFAGHERHTDSRDMRCPVGAQRRHCRQVVLLEKGSRPFVHVQSSVSYRIPIPPSTLIDCPVMYSAAGEARWETTEAISAGSACRPRGTKRFTPSLTIS